MVSVTDMCPACGKEVCLSNKNIFICKYCNIELDIYIGNGSIEAISWKQGLKYIRINSGWKIIIMKNKDDKEEIYYKRRFI